MEFHECTKMLSYRTAAHKFYNVIDFESKFFRFTLTQL